MTPVRLKFHARRDHFLGDTIEILIAAKRGEEVYAIGQPIEFKAFEPMDTAVESRPALVMGREAAQNLMDELWHVGIRPTEGAGSAGSLAATERHLADMRDIVFKRTPKN